jgi:hypothetical protein
VTQKQAGEEDTGDRSELEGPDADPADYVADTQHQKEQENGVVANQVL